MNLTVVVTGAVSAAFTPYWANWLRLQHPDVKTRYLVSESAAKFVSLDSLRTVSGGSVHADSWTAVTDPLHVQLGDWMDAMIAHPCSFHYLARVAAGSVETPSLLAHACADVPLVLAPSLPPGAYEGRLYRRHAAALRAREDVHVVEPHPVRSAVSSREAYGAAPMTECLAHLKNRRAA